MRTYRFLVPALAVALAAPLTLADSKGHSQAIEYRGSLMEIYKWNMGPMGAMVKGDKPYDQTVFKARATDLNSAAHLDLLAGFPPGSDQGDDTEAKPEIWKDWDGFAAKYQDFKKATAELAAAAGGDLEAVKPKFAAVGKACKSCHESFRQD